MTLTAQHEKIRAKRITGSRIAGIIGVSKYHSPMSVYMELAEGVSRDVNEESPDILRGNFLEPAILDWYRHTTGLVAHKATPRVHPELGHLFAAAADAFAGKAANDWDRTVEIKAPRRADDWGDTGTDQIPEYHLPQVVLEMACAGLERADVAALIHGELRVYSVPRDRELEQAIIDAGQKFWRDHVEKRVPPPVDGSAAYDSYIAKRFPEAGKIVLASTPEADELAHRLAATKATLKQHEESVSELEQRLKLIIGDAAGVAGDWGKISWSSVKGRTSTDWDALCAAHKIGADELAKFVKQSNPHRAFRATFKKGAA